MQVIGFTLSNITANRSKDFSYSALRSGVEFKEPIKEKLSMLKDAETISLDFTYLLSYQGKGEKSSIPVGELKFEGSLLCSLSKNESKDLFKDWKKQETAMPHRIQFTNIIMRRCMVQALHLQEAMNLPFHPRPPFISPDAKFKKAEDK